MAVHTAPRREAGQAIANAVISARAGALNLWPPVPGRVARGVWNGYGSFV